ncbi:MAG: carboxylesterase family protein [Tannerella sp.]|jgi:predicted esterase|nr:carboxylesterase family protein [Tannerella sp.]
MKKISLIVLFSLIGLSHIWAGTHAVQDSIEKQTFLYAVKETDSLFLDCWINPTLPSIEKRPVLMFVFGGGFMGGSRWLDFYSSYFNHFTKQGFMVVSIDYRLGIKKAKDAGQLTNDTFANALVYALSIAVDDLTDATAFIVNHANELNIDVNNIIISGSSAGAVTCLHTEYEICNQTEVSKRLPANFNYAGLISFAGAILTVGDNLTWKKPPCPLLLFHGDGDNYVPYNVIRENGFGGFGSKYISEQMTFMNVPHWFYSVENAAHELAEKPMSENLNELDTFIDKLIFKKQPLIIQTNIKQTDKPGIRKDYTKISDFIH